jgi:hypothetical protein
MIGDKKTVVNRPSEEEAVCHLEDLIDVSSNEADRSIDSLVAIKKLLQL